jgi:hypothetical protein
LQKGQVPSTVPHSKSTIRERAVICGLEFIYREACRPGAFDEYGFDYLFSFRWIASTSLSPAVRAMARTMGRERARLWRRQNPIVPPDADADTITNFVFANLAANRFGIRDPGMKTNIAEWAPRFSAVDYFWFDAVKEPPPTDVPADCVCGATNPRGASRCQSCKKRLAMMSRYEVLVVALIRSYMGERYGVPLGARLQEVIKWLPELGPYPEPDGEPNGDFIWSIYAVTHLVYALNDYSTFRLSPHWLPLEFEFLKRCVPVAISTGDPETMGEILDSLKSFGLGERSQLLREGMDYLIRTQNADGSWGDPDADDTYDRYHPTLTAINGLREYSWRGLRLSFPKLRSTLGIAKE